MFRNDGELRMRWKDRWEKRKSRNFRIIDLGKMKIGPITQVCSSQRFFIKAYLKIWLKRVSVSEREWSSKSAPHDGLPPPIPIHSLSTFSLCITLFSVKLHSDFERTPFSPYSFFSTSCTFVKTWQRNEIEILIHVRKPDWATMRLSDKRQRTC